LTDAIPPDWIPAVVAWCNILSFFGSGVLTALHGFSSGNSGPLVGAPPFASPKAVVALLGVGLAAAALGFASPASAQSTSRPKPALTGDPIRDLGNAVKSGQQQSASRANETTADLVGKLNKLALPDFEYALAMAKATNNVVSAPCWQAWVDMLTAQQKPLTDAAGQALTEPDPHLITNIERVSELLAALRPDSPLSTSCAALAGAANRDVATLIGGILSGGALGLFKLPVIP
ncbi:MAG TPA: hypothetical protein VIY51_21870, partial [Xanthobacteraceae bacterium]